MLAPFNEEVARRLNRLDEAIAAGAALTIEFAAAGGGQPDRIVLAAKKPKAAALSFAFLPDVAATVADIMELDEANAETVALIRTEVAKAPE